MITLKEDSEFMKNLLPANPVPAGNRFVAIKDAESNPALLAVSQDQKLNLIIKKDGKPTLIDYGKLCGLQGNVLTFDVYQDTNLTLWFAVATDAGNNQSHFYLIVNVAIDNVLSPPQDSVVDSGIPLAQIHGIYMSNFVQTVGAYHMPMIFLAFQPTDRITSEDQLGYLNIVADSSNRLTISLNTTWKLATDPLKIIDVAFGTAVVGSGAFVLYESTNGLHLQFRVFGGHNFSVEVAAPSGASCIDSYVDLDSGDSVLLVGGDVVTKFTSQQYVRAGSQGTPIVTKDKSLGMKDLHLTRTEKSITIWYTTVQDAVHYYTAALSSLDDGLLVQLLPDGAGGQVSGLLSATSADETVLVHTLLSVDQKGFITMLQQATDSGMWETIPFYTPSKTNNMEIPSYTIRVSATADGSNTDESIPNCLLHVKSDCRIQVTANGSSSVIESDGTWMTCDSSGVLTLIVATADLACSKVTIDGFQSPKGYQETLADFVVNPTQKATQKLQPITSGSQLLKATTQTGEKLILPDTVSEGDADQAAGMISQLTTVKPTSVSTSKGGFKKQTRQVKFTPEQRRMKPVHLAGVLPEDPKACAKMFELGSSSSVWDFFHNLYEDAKSVVAWSLQTFEDGLHLVLTWAGDAYRFALDSIQAVGKAVSWVFKKILVAVEKLIDFIGFLFEWNDVLTTADSINTYMNAGLSYSHTQVGALQTAVDAYMQTLKETVTNGKVQPQNQATASNQPDPEQTDSMSSTKEGVSYNFGSYHMQHSGFATDSTVTPQQSSTLLKDSDTDIQAIWNSISKEVMAVEDLVKNIANDIQDLLTPNTNTDAIFAKMKDQMITAALDTIQNVADTLLEAASLVISEIQSLGNASIEVPIFSALWNLITKGRPFTLFNCLSLILAIPTTILFKLAARTAPPALQGRLNETTFGQYVTSDPSIDPQLKQDITAFTACAAITAGGLSFVTILISFVTDEFDQVGFTASNVQTIGSDDHHTPKLKTGKNAGNAIDSALTFFTGIGLFFSWPLKYGHDQNLRWGVWGLDLSNGIFLALSRVVGYKLDIPRVETKRAVGIWEVVTSIPMYILQIIVDVKEFELPSTDPEKNDALTSRHIIEETADLVSSWAFGVAALNDEVQEEITAVALAVMGIAIVLKMSFKFVDFVIWYETPKKPEAQRPPVGGPHLLLEKDDGEKVQPSHDD